MLYKTRIKRTLITASLLSLVSIGIYASITAQSSQSFTSSGSTASTASSTQPTRLEQTQALIDELQKQRQNDPTFIAETDREMQALKESRITQSRLDALFIVQTQIDDEIAGLKATSSSKK